MPMKPMPTIPMRSIFLDLVDGSNLRLFMICTNWLICIRSSEYLAILGSRPTADLRTHWRRLYYDRPLHSDRHVSSIGIADSRGRLPSSSDRRHPAPAATVAERRPIQAHLALESTWRLDSINEPMGCSMTEFDGKPPAVAEKIVSGKRRTVDQAE